MFLCYIPVGPIENFTFQTWGPSNLGQNSGFFYSKIQTFSGPFHQYCQKDPKEKIRTWGQNLDLFRIILGPWSGSRPSPEFGSHWVCRVCIADRCYVKTGEKLAPKRSYTNDDQHQILWHFSANAFFANQFSNPVFPQETAVIFANSFGNEHWGGVNNIRPAPQPWYQNSLRNCIGGTTNVRFQRPRLWTVSQPCYQNSSLNQDWTYCLLSSTAIMSKSEWQNWYILVKIV